MSDTPLRIRGIYRATSHLPIWDVIQDAGIWQEVGIELLDFEYVDESTLAENALLSGDIDFISGNHISTYTLFAHGKPIVHLTSPSNSVNDVVVTREPITSLADLRGVRLGDIAMSGPQGGYAHTRGNHLLYLKRAGVPESEVQWVELAPKMGDTFWRDQLAAMKEGRIDATFVTGSTAVFEEAGFHSMPTGPLPMINGPTITCSSETLRRKPGLAVQLVKAQVMGVAYATKHPDETNRILAERAKREGTSAQTADRISKLPRKPYPEMAAVAAAYELACLQHPETEKVSPLSLWDVHYLRELDDSGYIDSLYA